jgi:hypothetical protein
LSWQQGRQWLGTGTQFPRTAPPSAHIVRTTTIGHGANGDDEAVGIAEETTPAFITLFTRRQELQLLCRRHMQISEGFGEAALLSVHWSRTFDPE